MVDLPGSSRRVALVLLIATLLVGCHGGSSDAANPANVVPRFSSDFESGSIHAVTQLDQQGLAWELKLRNDNDDATLPNSFRTWWYVRAENVPTQQGLRLEFSRLGFPYYFVPVYSYDGKTWQYFEEAEVALAPGFDLTKPDSCRLVIHKKFAASTVWIARTFPYTNQDLSSFLNSISVSPHVRIDTLGASPRFQKPLSLITISDATVSSPRKTIWIHARTHAAETGPSFVLEGLIRAVLADDATAKALRQYYIFKIVPMHNQDGVFLGNYRTNASSIDLEARWMLSPGSPYLDAAAPLENRLINQGAMVPALLNAAAPVVLALNLHSSNATPDTAAFFFPHFGSDSSNYSVAQRNIWQKQIAFIQEVARNYGGRIEQPPADGGSGFLNSFFPETWWWTQAQDSVNAMTLETTYGRAGFGHWVTENDLRDLGTALALAINNLPPTQSHSARTDDATDTSMFRLPFKPEIYIEPE